MNKENLGTFPGSDDSDVGRIDAQAAVVVRAGPVRVGVGRALAPRPVAAPVVRARRAYVRHEVHENCQEAWNNFVEAVNGL